jgi:uncharacterized protein
MSGQVAAFHVMLKPRGAVCNLDCRYCYYLKKEQLYPQSNARMSASLLEEFTRQYLGAQTAPQVTFGWQGGEPTLMGMDFFRQAVEFQKKYARPGTHIVNTIQTNGIFLDEDWCRFLGGQGFLVGLSLDGPQALHDRYRLDKGGGGTHALVMRSLELLQRHAVEYNILACVSAANVAHPLQVYRFLRDQAAARFVQFIPIVERSHPLGYQQGSRLTDRSISGHAYGDFLITIYDEWLRGDVGRISVQVFDVALAVSMGQRAGLCIYEQTCGQTLALEFNGDLYACDHYVEPDFRLGNIQEKALAEMVVSSAQRSFGVAKSASLPGYCSRCPVLRFCHGGCPKERIDRTPQGEAGLNHLCAGLRAFFSYIPPTMKLLAAFYHLHRPLEDLPHLLAGGKRLSECAPGDVCPCGSGKAAGECHAVAEKKIRKR